MLDNSRPDSSNYPTSEPREWSADDNVLVSVGDYVVNGDGDIVVATTSNKETYPNEFLRSLNEPYFRAKYLGQPGDYLEFANRSRLATPEEVRTAESWTPGAQATNTGQLLLL